VAASHQKAVITSPQVLNMINVHSNVVTNRPIPRMNLPAGATGVVVHVYPGGAAYEVEFISGEGRTWGVETMTADELTPQQLAAIRADAVRICQPVPCFGAQTSSLRYLPCCTSSANRKTTGDTWQSCLSCQGRCASGKRHSKPWPRLRHWHCESWLNVWKRVKSGPPVSGSNFGQHDLTSPVAPIRPLQLLMRPACPSQRGPLVRAIPPIGQGRIVGASSHES